MPKSKRLFNAVNRRELVFPLLLIAPTLLVLLSLTIYPLIYSVTISLQTQTNEGSKWSAANFTRLLSDSFFLTSLIHTLIYAIAALTFEFLIGLGLALLLNSQIRGRGFFRATLLVPMMLPTVVVGVVWRLMLNPNFGAINGTLKQFGFDTDVDCLTSVGNAVCGCSRRLAMDSVCFSGPARGIAGHSTGALRGRVNRRIEQMANFSICHSTSSQTGNPDRALIADNGSASCV